jgi:hypothetical protein
VEDGHVRLDRAQALKVLEFMERRKRRRDLVAMNEGFLFLWRGGWE